MKTTETNTQGQLRARSARRTGVALYRRVRQAVTHTTLATARSGKAPSFGRIHTRKAWNWPPLGTKDTSTPSTTSAMGYSIFICRTSKQ